MLPPLIVSQIQAAYTAGYKKCLEDKGQLKPYMSLSQANAKYGRKTVESWVKQGLVEVIKDGADNCKCRIKREQIELVANTSNRASWYEHNSNNDF